MNKVPALSISLFLSILLLAIIGDVALDVYLPSLPYIEKFFSTSEKLVQFSITAYLISYSLSQLFYGPFSDRFGRRKVALFGISISCLGSIICFLSFNIYVLLLGRLIQGFGLGASAAIYRPVLRDVSEGDRLSHLGSILAIGAAVAAALGPTIGGYIQYYLGWRGTFLFVLSYTLFTIVFIWRYLPETNTDLNPQATKLSSMRNYLHLITNPIFIGYCACASLGFGGIAAYLAVSPFLFQNVVGLTPIEYGMLSFYISGGIIAGGYLNSKMVKKIGRHRTLVLGTFVLFCSSTAMLLFGLFQMIGTFVIIMPMAFCVIGAGMIFTNSFAGAFTPFAKIAGFAGALYGCLQMGWGSIATLIMTKVGGHTQIPLAIFLMITAICAYFFQLLAFKYYMRHQQHG